VTTFTINVAAAPDTTRPTPVISYVGASLTNQSTFDVEVDFREPMAAGTFTLSDFTVSKGTTSNLRDLGNGKFAIAYTTAGEGAVTFAVAANVATDLAGNQNLAATSVTRTIDTTGFLPTLSTTTAALSNVTSFVVTIAFGEPVFGFTLADLSVLGGTASNLITANAATGSYTATITPTADGTVTVLLPAGLVTDSAENGNSAAVPLIRTIDRNSPSVSLTTNEPERTNRTTFDVFAQFSESVSGLTKAGLNISGGTASDPVLVSQNLYRFTITASVGAVQMQVVASAANDLAGNASLASSPLTITVDPAVVLTPTVSSTSATILSVATFNAAVNFGTQVNGFTLNDIVVVNGVASNLTVVDVATGRYAFTVNATTDGQVSVLLPAGIASDSSGNANSASNTLARIVDRVAPQPTLSVNVPSITNQSNFVLRVEFGEEVTGFELNDVVASGATLSALQHLGGGRYTMNVTAINGPVSFNLPAGIANDLAGNANVAATQVNLKVDTSSPLPALTTTAPSLINAASFTVAANFGERVLGFELSDLLLINGVASNLVEVNQAAGSYTFVVTPVADGVASVLIPAGAAADQAGNLTRVSSLLSRTFDRVAPVPVLTTTEPSRTNKTSFEVITNFGETVTGLTKSDFQVAGATISDPLDLGGGRYAVTVSGASGTVELQLLAGAAQDSSGNSSVASAKLTITVDSAALVPVISSSSPSLLNVNSFDVTVLFGKEVTGLTASKITVLGGSLSNLVEADRASGRYTFNVLAAADGSVTVLVPAGVVTDLAGNTNAASNNLPRTIDRIKPQPTFSVPFASVTNQSTFDVTVDFNESVTGFELTDLIVSGVTLSNLRLLNGGRYLVTATASNGPISISLPAATATDLAGNTSEAATTLSRTVDLTAVTVTLTTTIASLSNASSFVVAIDFAESVNGFTISDVTVLNGGASNLITTDVATGKYSVTVTPAADGSVTVLLPANSVSDNAGNGNAAAIPLMRSIDRVVPRAVLSTSEPERTNKTVFEVFADFGEAITGFTRGDIVSSGASVSDPRLLSAGRYAFTVTATASEAAISLPAAAVVDAAGNASLASNILSRSIDTTRTLPVLSSATTSTSNVDSFLVAIDFEKQVVGFTESSMFVVGGSLSEFTVFDDASGKYSVRVTPSADGVVTLLLPASAATDLVGNGNLAAAPLVRTIDRVAPVLTLSSTQSSPSLNTTFEVIVQSTKAITGLSAASFNVSGGSIGEPVSLGSERYSVMVTAAGGMFELSVNPGAVSDSAGNVNVGSNVLQIDVAPRSPILAPKVTGEAIDLTSMSDTELLDVETIDLRGFGDNVLTLDSDKIRTLFADASVTIYADPGDTIAFDGDWQFVGIELVDGAIHRIFTKAGASIFVNGPLDYTNPQNRFDVDASGEVVALDGLLVLTTIRNKRLASANGSFLPMTTENLSQYRFVDVSRDNLVTPLDALLVLNEVRRQGREGSGGAGEQVVVVPMQNAPLIAMATSSSSTRTEDRDSTSAELVIIGDASQNPAKTISYGPQQWRVNTTRISDDEHGEQNDRMSLIDEAFADPLLLNW